MFFSVFWSNKCLIDDGLDKCKNRNPQMFLWLTLTKWVLRFNQLAADLNLTFLPQAQQAVTHVHTTQTRICALIASSKSMTVTLLQSTARTKIRNKWNYNRTINGQLNNRLDLLWLNKKKCKKQTKCDRSTVFALIWSQWTSVAQEDYSLAENHLVFWSGVTQMKVPFANNTH